MFEKIEEKERGTDEVTGGTDEPAQQTVDLGVDKGHESIAGSVPGFHEDREERQAQNESYRGAGIDEANHQTHHALEYDENSAPDCRGQGVHR